jgi:Tfp pilus assembly protein FimV
LTRSFQGDVARAYYPQEWLGPFDALAAALQAAWNASAPANDRAGAFMQAAFITRTNGLDLLGTEVEPDWRLCEGDREDFTWRERETNAYENAVFFARPEETRRAAEHSANPERRFHYRYQAVLLAWEAAKLMPNESDDTAYLLYTAGSWLKNSDPETADIFYKALVRRNRKTALGSAADLRRWFPTPSLGDGTVPLEIAASPPEPVPDGPISEDEPARAEMIAPTQATREEAEPSIEYMVRPGDTLSQIARAFNRAGFRVSLEGILQSNPGLVPERIIGGQTIHIPPE